MTLESSRVDILGKNETALKLNGAGPRLNFKRISRSLTSEKIIIFAEAAQLQHHASD